MSDTVFCKFIRTGDVFKCSECNTEVVSKLDRVTRVCGVVPKGKKANCDFESSQLADGNWKHECRVCGTLRINKNQFHTRTCRKKTIVEQIDDSVTSLAKAASKALVTSYVTPEIFENRMSICRACPYFRASSQSCGHCGCYLKVKASLNTSACPIEKWGPTQETKPEQTNQDVVRELLEGPKEVSKEEISQSVEVVKELLRENN